MCWTHVLTLKNAVVFDERLSSQERHRIGDGVGKMRTMDAQEVLYWGSLACTL